jgi:hypothetical protein
MPTECSGMRDWSGFFIRYCCLYSFISPHPTTVSTLRA